MMTSLLAELYDVIQSNMFVIKLVKNSLIFDTKKKLNKYFDLCSTNVI